MAFVAIFLAVIFSIFESQKSLSSREGISRTITVSTGTISSSTPISATYSGQISAQISAVQTATTTSADICSGLPQSQLDTATTITNGPIISIDFDDGFISEYNNALSIINGAGFPTTQYIITGFLTREGRVNKQQILAMQAAGNEIGAHTRTHPYLAKIPEAQARDEICGSKKDLIAIGITPKTLAYPEGNFDPTVENIVKQAGFLGARTTEAGLNNSGTNRFALRSYQMNASTTFAQVKFVIDQGIADKEWLTLVFHRVDENGNPISVTHQLIQQVVSYIKSTGTPVVTESQGLAIMNNITGVISDLKSYKPPSTTPTANK